MALQKHIKYLVFPKMTCVFCMCSINPELTEEGQMSLSIFTTNTSSAL